MPRRRRERSGFAVLVPPAARATFQGIVRADGRVATRNYLGVFIVGHSGATIARKIAAAFTDDVLAAYPHIDGVVPYIHAQGSGMERSGEPMDLLRRTLAGYIRHPNTAGAARKSSIGLWSWPNPITSAPAVFGCRI